MPKTFLFYDIETSGLNPVFDQIIQFSAIRTDLELNELERYEWVVRPNPETIPSPMAMIIHRTPLSTWQKGEPELTVIQKIHALFNTPNTISLGYNTLGFDDEFLRFSFYRNLLAPYTHQYANNCSRADLYPITALYYLFHPQIISWPIRHEKISLKLDALNQENHLTSGAAHTAIVDIEATIALAKKFMQQKDSWHYCLDYFDKKTDEERMNKLPFVLEKKHAIIIDGIFGATQNFCAPVLHLGTHYHYKNQSCWLRLDTEDLFEKPWVINKKLAEPGFLLPPSEKYLSKLHVEKKELLNINLHFLEKNPAKLEEIINYYLDFTYPKYEHIDPSAELYQQPFWTNEQQSQLQQFHRVALEKKSAVINIMRDPILKILAIRILGRIDKNLLSHEQLEMLDESEEKMIDYKGKPKLNREQALAEIQALKVDATLDDEQKNCLLELEKWFTYHAC